MPFYLPEQDSIKNYRRVPFQFTEELSSKNVFVRLPDEFSPLERMILQASGNLQRLLSAYYNVPSRVEIIRNEQVPKLTNGHGGDYIEFDREIKMHFGEKVAYIAHSRLVVKDKTVLDLIQTHKYGLGQIFGHTRKTPNFVLHAVGRHDDRPGASFWRDYSLTVPDILDCFIRETFLEDLFEQKDYPTTNGSTTQALGTVWISAPM